MTILRFEKKFILSIHFQAFFLRNWNWIISISRYCRVWCVRCIWRWNSCYHRWNGWRWAHCCCWWRCCSCCCSQPCRFWTVDCIKANTKRQSSTNQAIIIEISETNGQLFIILERLDISNSTVFSISNSMIVFFQYNLNTNRIFLCKKNSWLRFKYKSTIEWKNIVYCNLNYSILTATLKAHTHTHSKCICLFRRLAIVCTWKKKHEIA